MTERLVNPVQPKLTTSKKKFLKGIAHGLRPVILIGANGLTPAVSDAVEEALSHHELLKIKMAEDDRDARQAMINALVEQTGAQIVQSVGKIVVLLRLNVDSELAAELPK
ncbi:ribosome assembly RNA-binding protein YhbY [Thiomicrospira sp. WB1]|jgi:RNA-binding protein|uniref:ribosome assembly RNA-binding protein YhbY n=1 Tax=Thiomicrospira sp. WB1 TaxID=1685380 RepID=UPI0007489F4C|nr:ribosome assembly RNA-binding protein YhbY [Thiomicrospira sp. WB1]KUJ71828.1 RNA-binding protein [Thiomicrospira sp. WB1]